MFSCTSATCWAGSAKLSTLLHYCNTAFQWEVSSAENCFTEICWFFLKKTMRSHQHSYNNIALAQGVLGKNNSSRCKALVAQMFPLYFAKTVRFICSNVSLLLFQIWEQILYWFPPAQKNSIIGKQTEKLQWVIVPGLITGNQDSVEKTLADKFSTYQAKCHGQREGRITWSL